jgi:hypothetical protein
MPVIQRGEYLAHDIEELVIAGRTCDFGPCKYDTAFLAGMHETTDQAALQGDREDAWFTPRRSRGATSAWLERETRAGLARDQVTLNVDVLKETSGLNRLT